MVMTLVVMVVVVVVVFVLRHGATVCQTSCP
jgi:hypothetical protein